MKSSHRRVSRALVIGVGATITLAAVFWLWKLSGSRAAGTPKGQPVRTASIAPIEPSVAPPVAKPASATTQPLSTAAAATRGLLDPELMR